MVFEESYGCLIGTHARDKDAIVATMALCEAAAYYKTKNMTLWDAMLAMYESYGYYKDGVTASHHERYRGTCKDPGDHVIRCERMLLQEIGGYKVTGSA